MGHCLSFALGMIMAMAGGSHGTLANTSPDPHPHHAHHMAGDQADQQERWQAEVDLTPVSTDPSAASYRAHLK
ncbi:MAG: hypothetical protein ACK5VW_06610, partial [Holosporales bacterium]